MSHHLRDMLRWGTGRLSRCEYWRHLPGGHLLGGHLLGGLYPRSFYPWVFHSAVDAVGMVMLNRAYELRSLLQFGRFGFYHLSVGKR